MDRMDRMDKMIVESCRRIVVYPRDDFTVLCKTFLIRVIRDIRGFNCAF